MVSHFKHRIPESGWLQQGHEIDFLARRNIAPQGAVAEGQLSN